MVACSLSIQTLNESSGFSYSISFFIEFRSVWEHPFSSNPVISFFWKGQILFGTGGAQVLFSSHKKFWYRCFVWGALVSKLTREESLVSWGVRVSLILKSILLVWFFFLFFFCILLNSLCFANVFFSLSYRTKKSLYADTDLPLFPSPPCCHRWPNKIKLPNCCFAKYAASFYVVRLSWKSLVPLLPGQWPLVRSMECCQPSFKAPDAVQDSFSLKFLFSVLESPLGELQSFVSCVNGLVGNSPVTPRVFETFYFGLETCKIKGM